MNGQHTNGSTGLLIAHLSDLHLGAHVPQAVDSLVEDVVQAAPTLTVVTGDSTMRARAHEFGQARALLDRLPMPQLVVPGNHDVPLGVVHRLTAPYDRYQRWIDPELEPIVAHAGVCAVGLNSMPRWRWKDGRVSSRQIRWATGAIAAAPAGAFRLLALHHPLFGRPAARRIGRFGLLGRSRLATAIVDVGVELVLAGHEHVPRSRSVDWATAVSTGRLVEVVAGTATSWRTRGTRRSWTLVRVDPAAIEVQERYETGGAWQPSATTRYPRRSCREDSVGSCP